MVETLLVVLIVVVSIIFTVTLVYIIIRCSKRKSIQEQPIAVPIYQENILTNSDRSTTRDPAWQSFTNESTYLKIEQTSIAPGQNLIPANINTTFDTDSHAPLDITIDNDNTYKDTSLRRET